MDSYNKRPVPAEGQPIEVRDGKFLIPDVSLPQRAIIEGDRLCLSIGCASILAKEIRDRIMEDFDSEYPGYGFVRHKGYATAEHLEMLQKLAPALLRLLLPRAIDRSVGNEHQIRTEQLPGLLAERLAPPKGAKTWDKALVSVLRLMQPASAAFGRWDGG